MAGSTTSTSGRSVRTIRLSDEEVTKLLDGLDESAPAHEVDRRVPRYTYRMKALVVHMQQPGSSEVTPFLVATRNLSSGGLSFLHGGFVHPGTQCVAQLITMHGTWQDARGKVVSCRYIKGTIHEVSIQFEYQIDSSAFSASAFRARVLIAEDDPSIARLLRFHLEQLNAHVEHVENGKLAVEKALLNAYDLILMDIEMPVMDGFEATAELRRQGYSGRIVAGTAHTLPADRDRCLEGGFSGFLAKPFKKEDLSVQLQALRTEPLFSTLTGDSGLTPLINDYVAGLPERVRKIESALADNDVDQLTHIARTLKGESSSYGFEPIGLEAQKLEKLLLDGTPIKELISEIQTLAQLCMQARDSSEGLGLAVGSDDTA